MTEQTKKDLMSKLETVFNESLQIENRKQFKELIKHISEVNTFLIIECGLMVKNLPTDEQIDELFEGTLDNAADKVKFAISDAEEALDNM